MSKYKPETIQSERQRNVTADNVKERLKYERYYKAMQKQLRKDNQLRSHQQTKFREQQMAKLGRELALKEDTKQLHYHKGTTNSNAKNYGVQMISEAFSTKLELKNEEPNGNCKKNFTSRQSTSFSDRDAFSPGGFVDSQTSVKCVKHCASFPTNKHRTTIGLSNQKDCRCLSAEPSLPTIYSRQTKAVISGKDSSLRFLLTRNVKSQTSARQHGTRKLKSNLLYTSSKHNQQCDIKKNESLLGKSKPDIMPNHEQTDTRLYYHESQTDKVRPNCSEEPNTVVRKHLNAKARNSQLVLGRRTRLQEMLKANPRQERVGATMATMRKFEVDQKPQQTPKPSSQCSEETLAIKSKTVTWMDSSKPLNSINEQSTDDKSGPSPTTADTGSVKYEPIGQPINCTPVKGDLMRFKHKMPPKKKRNDVFHTSLDLSTPAARLAAGNTSDTALPARWADVLKSRYQQSSLKLKGRKQ